MNDVLLSNESIMFLHCSRQLQLSHLGKFRSIMFPIIDCTQLGVRTDSSVSATQLRTFAYQKSIVFHFPRPFQLSDVGQFRSAMIAIIDRTQLSQKRDSSRSVTERGTFAQRIKYVIAF